MEDAPHANVLLIQIGGLGDLVLTSEMVAQIKRERPGWRVSLMCRAEVASTLELYPVRPDEVLELSFNPYCWAAPSEEMYAALAPVIAELQGRQADLLLAVSLQPTWFSWVAAAAVAPAAALACTPAAEPADFIRCVLDYFGLNEAPVKVLEPPPASHELDRYRLMLRELDIRPAAAFSQWTVSAETLALARRHLAGRGLCEGEYLVCFPTGSANTRLKRWPEERFVEVLEDLSGDSPVSVLLIGEAADEGQLTRIADRLRGRHIAAGVFCGQREDIPLVGGLVSLARAYFGNDTGPVHLASAYGVPGVAIFGGGTWPGYSPWGRGSIGIVHPLPCFDCNWDCAFGRAICVDAIEPAAVLAAVRSVLAEPPGSPAVRSLDSVPAATREIIRGASLQYRMVQEDRSRRLDLLLRHSLADRRHSGTADPETMEKRNAELERAAAERLAALEATEAARQQFEAAAEARQVKLLELARQLEEQQKRNAELERAAAERLVALEATEAARRQLEAAAEIERSRCSSLARENIALKNEKLLNFLIRRYKTRPQRTV